MLYQGKECPGDGDLLYPCSQESVSKVSGMPAKTCPYCWAAVVLELLPSQKLAEACDWDLMPSRKALRGGL